MNCASLNSARADEISVENAVAAIAEALTASDNAPAFLARLRIPKSAIAEHFSRDYREETPVDRVILGIRSQGQAVCTGKVQCDFLPNSEMAEIRCQLTGTVTSNTSGRSGPATIFSHSLTHYTAKKDILFDGNQFYSRPAVVTSNTKITPTGVGTSLPGLRGRIVRRIAGQRVKETIPQAQIISGRITEKELQQQIDAEFNTQLIAMNRDLGGVLNSVKSFSGGGRRVSISTHQDHIELSFGRSITNSIITPTLSSQRLGSKPIELWLYFPDRNFSKMNLTNVFSSMPLWLANYFPSSPQISLLAEKELSVASNRSWVLLQLNSP